MRRRSPATALLTSSLALALALLGTDAADARAVRRPSRFVPGDLTIAAAVNNQTAPFLVQGGATLLAIWSDDRANSTGGYEGETSEDIYGMRFDAAGTPLEPVPFAVTAEQAAQENPRAAWNGTNWLVVYESYDVSGTGYYQKSMEAVRVSPGGQVLDPKPIKIFNATPIGATWAVASDGADWVIVTQGTSVESDLVAFRVSAGGVLLDAAPRSLVPGTYYLRGGLHLAYVGGVFLLAYEESMTSYDPTSAIRFDADLNPLDPAPYNLVGTPLSRLVSNGGGLYAVWNEQLPDSSMAVKGSRIGTNGQKLDGGGVNISGPNGPQAYTTTSVAWDGSSWKVTWGGPTGMRVARVNAAGQVLDPGGVLIAGAKTGLSASAGNGSVQTIGSEFVTNSYEILSSYISAANLAGPSRTLSVGAPSQLRADIAPSGSGYLLVYRSSVANRNRVLSQPLDAGGNPLTAEPTELDAADSSSYPGFPAVAWNGSVYLVAWNNASGVVARRLLPNGAPVDSAPFVVMSPAFGPADVEALGGDFLVAGLRCGINCQYISPIAARVRGSDAVLLDASPIVMGGTFSSNPRLAVLGGRWLLAWQANATHDNCFANTLGAFIDATGLKSPEFTIHGGYSSCGGNGIFTIGLASSGSVALITQSQELTSGVETDLLGRLIAPDGTVQPYINLTPWEGNQYRPRVAWDGAQFVVLWQDQRVALDGDSGLEQIDARSDLMGMRVSPSGVVVDPQGFVFSNSPIGEAYPNVAGSGGKTLIAASFMRNEPPLANYRIGYELLGAGGNQWPVPVASAAPAGGDVPLSVAFSSAGTADAGGSVAAHAWDFGDGATSTEADPTHLYTVGGPYVATLTATDNGGAQAMQEILIEAVEPNVPPVAVVSSDKTHGPTPLDVVFSATGSYDPDGFVGNIHWEFSSGGDSWGSPAYQTFYDTGPVQVTLTLYDARGGTGTATLDFTVDPPLAPAAPTGLSAIAFTSDWINMTWQDGSNNEDGFTVERCQGTQAFCAVTPAAWSEIVQVGRNIDYHGDTGLPSGTTFSYRVRAFNVTAQSAYSNSSTATTLGASPVAEMAPSVLNGPAPLLVQFDGSGSHDPDGTIVSWAWEFRDGATASGPVVSHAYGAEGTYYPLLTVTDNDGRTDVIERIIVVTAGNASSTAASDASTPSGIVSSGTYVTTQTQDDIAEVLSEVRTAGTPATRTTRLDHTWLLQVLPGSSQVFYLNAWHSPNSEGDDFVFGYSLDNVNWTQMFTVTKTVDDDVLQSYTFPQDVAGPVWIGVRDLDRKAGHGQIDTVSIDHLFVASSLSTGYCGEAASGASGDPSGALILTSLPGGALRLDWGVSCMGSDDDYAVYEGTIGNFAAHVPILCSTSGARTATIDPSPGSVYYLVVPSQGYHEGRYGTSSAGVDIPAGPTRCYPPALSTGCP
jgi:PKD repeat protein